MLIETVTGEGHPVAVIKSQTPVITDVRSALDVMMTAKYESKTDRIAIQKEALAEEFFILSSGLAGEILQKFTNYGVKCAIYGDLSHYTSKPLRDLIRESARGKTVFFADSEEAAAAWLAKD